MKKTAGRGKPARQFYYAVKWGGACAEEEVARAALFVQ